MSETAEPQSVTEAIAAAQSGGYGYDEAPPADEVVEDAPPVEETDDDFEDEESPAGDTGEEVPPAGQPDPDAIDAEELTRLRAIRNSMKTEQGLRQLGAHALIELGFTPQEVQAFVNRIPAPGEAPAPAGEQTAPIELPEDDEVVTGAQAKALVAEAAKQAVAEALKPFQQSQQEARQAAATALVDSTLISLLGDATAENPAATVDGDLAQDVINAAEKYLEPDDWNAAHIKEALVRGHADVMRRIDGEVTRRIEAKRRTRQKQPTSIGQGAGVGGGDAPAEPKNVDEARRMARDARAYDF